MGGGWYWVLSPHFHHPHAHPNPLAAWATHFCPPATPPAHPLPTRQPRRKQPATDPTSTVYDNRISFHYILSERWVVKNIHFCCSCVRAIIAQCGEPCSSRYSPSCVRCRTRPLSVISLPIQCLCRIRFLSSRCIYRYSSAKLRAENERSGESAKWERRETK